MELLAGEKPRQALAELAGAAAALPLARRDLQAARADSKILMAHETAKPSFTAQLLALTMRAESGAGIPGPDSYLSIFTAESR